MHPPDPQPPVPAELTACVALGLGNRDGDAFAVKTALGRCYLVLQAETLHLPETFRGMGSSIHIEISAATFSALANIADDARRGGSA